MLSFAGSLMIVTGLLASPLDDDGIRIDPALFNREHVPGLLFVPFDETLP